MQSVALAVIAISAVVIALLCVLLFKRAVRLFDETEETLRTVNRLAPKLEKIIDEAETQIATLRAITDRLTRVSERVEALTDETVNTVRAVLDPMKRLSKAIGVVKAAIVGMVAGAAVLRRARGAAEEKQEGPTPDHPSVGERSAS